MRTTVDIPDDLYRRLKAESAHRGCSVKTLVLKGVKLELENSRHSGKRKIVKLPVIKSRKPGWLDLTNSKINEILFP